MNTNKSSQARASAFLNEEVNIALQNLDFCRKLCEIYQDYGRRNVRPKLTLQFDGGPIPKIESGNGGIVATPVIFTAIMNIRKFTAFFGFTGSLRRKTSKDADDFDITTLGLPYPSFKEFIMASVSPSYNRQEFEDALRYLLRHANKMVGHFTMLAGDSNLFIDYRKLDVACIGVSQTIKTLVYDALRLTHPNIQSAEMQDRSKS